MLPRILTTLRSSSSSIPRMRAAYSTQNAMDDLHDVLRVAEVPKENFVRATPSINLHAGKPIRPYDLAYKGNQRRFRSKPPQVAPTSAEARPNDIFHQLDIDPLSLATHPLILAEFVTEMGLIKPRTQTGLTVKSQRRLGKAIRRARMMGVMPILSRSQDSRWS